METAKQPSTELAKRLNESVFSVIGSDNKMIGFEKAFLIATAAQQLKDLLTPEYMKPILALQNNKLGFKTDKEGGYPENTVKNCLIEAVLTGVQPFGNQFNIIAGNCYVTKEGFGYLLGNWAGLDYEIIPGLPRINPDRSSAAILMKVEWTIAGQKQTRELDIPVKMNQYMGTDAVIGKATRKARAWLHSRLSGLEIGDGDAAEFDGKHTIVIEPEPEVTIDALKLLLDEKMPLLTAMELRDAKRIIDGNETASFKKLFNLLTEKKDDK